MGVSWLIEGITYLAEDPNNKNPNFIVIIMDVWNLLQGLVIFILFVIKRRVLKLLKKRFVFKRKFMNMKYYLLANCSKFIP